MTRRAKKPSNVLPVPKAFAGLAKRRYITRTGPMMQPLDVCLRMALSLRHHGTAEAVRTLARKLVDQVCAEQKPRLKELARRPTNEWERQRNPNVLLNGVPDELVIPTAIKMIERYCYLAGLRPDEPFEWVDPAALADVPRCHYKPMRLAGDPDSRHWRCQHCSHTKPLTWRSEAAPADSTGE